MTKNYKKPNLRKNKDKLCALRASKRYICETPSNEKKIKPQFTLLLTQQVNNTTEQEGRRKGKH